MDQHLRVENIFLIYIDVHHIVLIAQLRRHVVLDGIDAMVDEDLLALHVAGEAAHAVVSDDDIRIEGLEQEIQRIQRRNLPTGRYIDVRAEGADPILRMHFRIGVDSDMTLIEMTHHVLLLDFFLCDQHRYGRALRVIVLRSDVQHMGSDHLGDLHEDLGQALGAVDLVNVSDVFFSFCFCTGIADVVHIEAECLCQIVETQQFELTPFHEVNCHPRSFPLWIGTFSIIT